MNAKRRIYGQMDSQTSQLDLYRAIVANATGKVSAERFVEHYKEAVRGWEIIQTELLEQREKEMEERKEELAREEAERMGALYGDKDAVRQLNRDIHTVYERETANTGQERVGGGCVECGGGVS